MPHDDLLMAISKDSKTETLTRSLCFGAQNIHSL